MRSKRKIKGRSQKERQKEEKKQTGEKEEEG